MRKVFPGNLPYRIPGRCSSNDNHSYHHEDKISQHDFYRICIHDVCPFSAAKFQQAEFLLHERKQPAEEQPEQSPRKGDHNPFGEKYPFYL